MRECLDCGVLMVPMFEERIQAFIETINKNTQKLHLYPVSLQQGQYSPEPGQCSPDLPVFNANAHGAYPEPSILSVLSQRLQRFDVILLPVSQASLVWTRLLLQQAPLSLLRPVVALTKEIHPVAMYDLVCLGVADFVFDPDKIEELRVRLLMILRHEQQRQWHEAATVPVLQEGSHKIRRIPQPSKPVFDTEVCCREFAMQANSFKEAKSRVIDQFEKTYLNNALAKCGGNIARAAKVSNKHRRAFWALMQKHNIKAAQFKDML